MSLPTIDAELMRARAELKRALVLDDREAALEAHILLASVLVKPRSYLFAHGDEVLGEQALGAFEQLLRRRLAGEPVAYILGQREFYGLSLTVSPAVLIPRPETELLVELALERIPADGTMQVLDLGTGSGAIALAIATHRPLSRVVAVDRSRAALAIAQQNALTLGVDNVQFLGGDWFAPLERAHQFDLIVANPPYVAACDPHLEQGDVRFEPRTALASGAQGLDDIARITEAAPAFLAPHGTLLLEHGFDQGEACRSLLQSAGFRSVSTHRDLGGQERIAEGRT